ncbi:unnamed protein product [Prunus armeniaca]|uniref:Uncharacterized protein n=1 Tax=Prunus armeniaca TaxID=36596 RepID=A0A6J5W4F9_PRUAR|nr:unnamed protein product [Prunus armeniaca]
MPIVRKDLKKPPLLFCELVSTLEDTPMSPTSKLSTKSTPKALQRILSNLLCHRRVLGWYHTSAEKGRRPATGRPSTSRRLFVPSSEEHHQEYQVYSDCRDRLNDRHKERQTFPIPIQTKLNDRRLDALGPKSPLRRR